MIVTEQYNDNLARTYSDTGHKIERDGVLYDEAIDPIDSGRTYTESEEMIEIEAEEATAEDLEAALKEAGVIA